MNFKVGDIITPDTSLEPVKLLIKAQDWWCPIDARFKVIEDYPDELTMKTILLTSTFKTPRGKKFTTNEIIRISPDYYKLYTVEKYQPSKNRVNQLEIY